MLHKTRGIVLHHIKYAETSIIAYLYTRAFGKQAYLIQGTRSKKSSNKANLLQCLYLLDMEVYHKDKRELQRVKEIKPFEPYFSIPFDIVKTSIVQFIAEILYKTLPEQEPDENLFCFLETMLISFDKLKNNVNNFHLHFLIQYLKYAGFIPENNFSQENKFFDLLTGLFEPVIPPHTHYFNENETKTFSYILSGKISFSEPVFNTSSERILFLEKLIRYYHFHFQNMKKLNSVTVLKEVFN